MMLFSAVIGKTINKAVNPYPFTKVTVLKFYEFLCCLFQGVVGGQEIFDFIGLAWD